MDAIREHRAAARPDGDRGRRASAAARRTGAGRSAASASSRRSSFHETKNLISGEGGALLVNAPALSRARRDHPREGHQPRQRSSAARSTSTPGWTSARRSCPSDIMAAFLWAQLEARRDHRGGRRRRYGRAITRPSPSRERAGLVRRPVGARASAQHNGHIYFLLLPACGGSRTLHRDPARARRSTRCSTTCRCTARPRAASTAAPAAAMAVTDAMSERLVRLPLWIGLEPLQDYVIDRCRHALGR